jgi:hypothetical protein
MDPNLFPAEVPETHKAPKWLREYDQQTLNHFSLLLYLMYHSVWLPMIHAGQIDAGSKPGSAY